MALVLGLGGLLPTGSVVWAAADAGEPLAAGQADQRKRNPHENDFLMFGTVFDERGFAYHGAVIRVRRAGERKTRWEARSDQRGEFAIRVPRGSEYDLTVQAKGYLEQTRRLNARTGSREDFVVRLQAGTGEKPK